MASLFDELFADARGVLFDTLGEDQTDTAVQWVYNPPGGGSPVVLSDAIADHATADEKPERDQRGKRKHGVSRLTIPETYDIDDRGTFSRADETWSILGQVGRVGGLATYEITRPKVFQKRGASSQWR